MTKFIFLNSVTKNQTLSQLLDKEELNQFIEKMTEYEYESYKCDDFNFDSEIAFSEYESEKNMLQTISDQFKNLSEEDKELYNKAISQSNATDSTKTIEDIKTITELKEFVKNLDDSETNPRLTMDFIYPRLED